MIQESSVGIGILGKEGSHAAVASDFVIHRFRHLERLLFIHGRYSWIRNSKVVLFSLYKNVTFSLPLFFYSFFAGFAGQVLCLRRFKRSPCLASSARLACVQ
jgi:P-type E1-E2 ATPase